MKLKELFNTWEQVNINIDKNQKLNKMELAELLKKPARKSTFILYLYLYFYLVLAMATSAMLLINLPGYSSNPTMTSVIIAMLLFMVVVLYMGVHLYIQLKEIDRSTGDLVDHLKKKKRFYRGKYRLWLVLGTLSAMILSFALNFYVDNMDGYYPIHNPLMIAGIMALMFILIYGSMEISFIRMHQEIRAYLHDIDNQVLESTRKIQKQRKKYVLFIAILAVILLAMMILALIKAAQF